MPGTGVLSAWISPVRAQKSKHTASVSMLARQECEVTEYIYSVTHRFVDPTHKTHSQFLEYGAAIWIRAPADLHGLQRLI